MSELSPAELAMVLGMGAVPVEADTARPRAWNWREMDAGATEVAMEELCTWVSWVITRYDLADQLPACWVQHGWAIEELSGAYAAWRGAYEDDQGLPTAAMDWHDGFDRLRDRLRRFDRYGCCSGVHRSGPSHIEALAKVRRQDSTPEAPGGAEPGGRRC